MNHHCVITTTSTGVAATLLMHGTTAHSAFQNPFETTGRPFVTPSYNSRRRRKIRKAEVIVIDEITMLDKDTDDKSDKICQANAEPDETQQMGRAHLGRILLGRASVTSGPR